MNPRLADATSPYLRAHAGNPVAWFPWGEEAFAEARRRDVPVMVSIQYGVRADKRAEFVAAMQAVREMRRRNGAYFWQLFHDSQDLTRYVEVFMDESWLEHLRQHERTSIADRDVLNRAKAYLLQGYETKPAHWLGDREN